MLKFSFFAVFITLAVLAITGYKIGDKTVPEYFQALMGKKEVQENMKDIKVLVGEAVKAVGSELADEVTDEERKKLNELVKDELQEGKGTSHDSSY